MAISGILITLSHDSERQRLACERLRRDQRLVVGELLGRHVAASAVTASPDDDLALVDELRRADGVDSVEIVFVALDEHSGAES
ncbi:MAG: hypothetical protein FJ253_00180 [Phycisphaerae bacterium]|nr:hypothetical protein [Phycisphaerae bacterium]